MTSFVKCIKILSQFLQQIIAVGVIGFLLVLLLALFIWFCCSIQDRLYRQKILGRVNKSEIGILRKYIDVLRERLNIARIGRIPTTIYREDDTTITKVLRALPKRVSTIIDPNIEEVSIEVQDTDNVFKKPPTPDTITEQIEIHSHQSTGRPEVRITKPLGRVRGAAVHSIIEEESGVVSEQVHESTSYFWYYTFFILTGFRLGILFD